MRKKNSIKYKGAEVQRKLVIFCGAGIKDPRVAPMTFCGCGGKSHRISKKTCGGIYQRACAMKKAISAGYVEKDFQGGGIYPPGAGKNDQYGEIRRKSYLILPIQSIEYGVNT